MSSLPTPSTFELPCPPGNGSLPASAASCAHCGQPLPANVRGDFCCNGCRVVHGALRGAGLDRFYALRGPLAEPVGELPASVANDLAFLEPLEAQLAAARAPLSLAVSVQGVRCAACVWAFEQLFARLPGALRVDVSVARGRAELHVAPGFPLRRYVEQLASLGYRVGADGTGHAHEDDDGQLLRMGVCAALAMNAMAFGAAIHTGVPHGWLHTLLTDLSFAAAVLTVLVGAPPFFRSAFTALRARALHLDVPIALGIALTSLAATWSYFGGHAEAAYFDSLAAFVALMVAGRYLQARAITRSRAELLDDPGLATQRCRRERDGRLTQVACSELEPGDVLLLPPGELAPVRVELLSEAANLSLAWIDGEAEPRAVHRGAELPAGAFNVGSVALRARVLETYADSALHALLRPPAARHALLRQLHRFSGLYVLAVLVLASAGLLGWWLATGDLPHALSVATAVCVVTCPCAIGIAIPLAYELVHDKLRRRGVFVRDGSFLDRARQVRTVVFDKTGTLTTGRLHVVAPEVLTGLPAPHRRALYQLCARSLHPKSLAVADVLEHEAMPFDATLEASELPGLGVEARIDGRVYRLGRGSFAAAGDSAAGEALCFGVDGALLAVIDTAETFRPDAARELAALERAGYAVFVLSGDDPSRVAAAAARLGLHPSRALGGQSPDAKATWLRAHDAAHTLMVGDGVNDAPATAEAHCSATPAVDRPFLPARTDFYFTTPGLSAIGAALLASRDLSALVRQMLAFAVLYNAVVVAAALSGAMAPWLAAIVMPLSSIVVVLRATATIARRSPSWKL